MPDNKNIDLPRVMAHLRGMERIRAFEEAALDAARDGRVTGAIHPYIGQEAVAVGVCAHLDRDDYLLSTHRGHGHSLAKGAEPEAMFRELYGRAGGTCQGKGGSMHIADFTVGMLGANGVVAANIPIAAGAAHAVHLLGENRIVACFFGDGAVNRGPFLEGLNWASVFGLGVLFVCEDNGYAATTRTRALTGGDGAAARARSLGVPAEEVDGNDIALVDETAGRLIGQIRAGGGPRLLVAKTYRLTGHTHADPGTYRTAEEVDAAWQRDPIRRCVDWLGTAGVAAGEIERVRAEARDEIRQADRAASDAPAPQPDAALSDVQDVGDPRAGAY